MTRSFYHYVLTLRGHDFTDATQVFADHVAKDHQFPKHSEEYEELSSYLEMDTDYMDSMSLFDEIWETYLENNKK